MIDPSEIAVLALGVFKFLVGRRRDRVVAAVGAVEAVDAGGDLPDRRLVGLARRPA
jgi:hypothetical protein